MFTAVLLTIGLSSSLANISDLDMTTLQKDISIVSTLTERAEPHAVNKAQQPLKAKQKARNKGALESQKNNDTELKKTLPDTLHHQHEEIKQKRKQNSL